MARIYVSFCPVIGENRRDAAPAAIPRFQEPTDLKGNRSEILDSSIDVREWRAKRRKPKESEAARFATWTDSCLRLAPIFGDESSNDSAVTRRVEFFALTAFSDHLSFSPSPSRCV